MNWIDVTKQLPPISRRFLAYSKNGEYAIVWHNSLDYVRGSWHGSCAFGCGGYDYFENITHWTELPEKPVKIEIDKEYFREKFEKVIDLMPMGSIHFTDEEINYQKKILLWELMKCFDNKE